MAVDRNKCLPDTWVVEPPVHISVDYQSHPDQVEPGFAFAQVLVLA